MFNQDLIDALSGVTYSEAIHHKRTQQAATIEHARASAASQLEASKDAFLARKDDSRTIVYERIGGQVKICIKYANKLLKRWSPQGQDYVKVPAVAAPAVFDALIAGVARGDYDKALKEIMDFNLDLRRK